MKHIQLISCIFIFLISTSCKKEGPDFVQNDCSTCGSKDSTASHETSTAIYINDSNWVRQGQNIFKSDLTPLLQQAGTTVSQVYSLQIVNQSSLLQFFPCCQVNYMGGSISGSVYSSGDNETCTLTFSFSDQNTYYGQTPNGGSLPFSSVLVKVGIWK
jgi:hypothetical protein